jgi:hypothetical protein
MPTDQKEITVNLLQANLYSLPIILMISGIMITSYLVVWGKEYFLEGFRGFRSLYTYLFLIIGFFLHEMIHLSGYHFLGKVAFKKIRIGFQVKSLTPYAYCSKSMTLNAYRWSALLPGIVLGILPGIYFLITGNSYIFILAMIFTIAAGGDFLLIWLLRKTPAKALVQDHPEKAGCLILEENL